MSVIDLSTLRNPAENAEPERGEAITVQTFKLPRLAQPAPRIAIAGVQLNDGRVANVSLHAEGLCLFFEAPGEQTRVMPREALLEGWLPAFVSVTEVMPPIDDERPDPVAHRLESDRVIHAADEAPIPQEHTP